MPRSVLLLFWLCAPFVLSYVDQCPLSLNCQWQYPYYQTKHLACYETKECPQGYSCCTDCNFRHSICKKPIRVHEVVTEEELFTEEYCPVQQKHCLHPISYLRSNHLACNADSECPNNYFCCKDTCYRHRVCKKAINSSKLVTLTPNSQKYNDEFCPKTEKTCDKPLPTAITMKYECNTQKPCMQDLVCCQDSCYSHRICKKPVVEDSSCIKDQGLCKTPKPYNETKIYECNFSNKRCTTGYVCCTDSCYSHNICKMPSHVTNANMNQLEENQCPPNIKKELCPKKPYSNIVSCNIQKDCLSGYKCCEDICLGTKVCKLPIATVVPTESPKILNQHPLCPRVQERCTTSYSLRILSKFQCVTDSDCKQGHACCTDECISYFKVCKPIGYIHENKKNLTITEEVLPMPTTHQQTNRESLDETKKAPHHTNQTSSNTIANNTIVLDLNGNCPVEKNARDCKESDALVGKVICKSEEDCQATEACCQDACIEELKLCERKKCPRIEASNCKMEENYKKRICKTDNDCNKSEEICCESCLHNLKVCHRVSTNITNDITGNIDKNKQNIEDNAKNEKTTKAYQKVVDETTTTEIAVTNNTTIVLGITTNENTTDTNITLEEDSKTITNTTNITDVNKLLEQTTKEIKTYSTSKTDDNYEYATGEYNQSFVENNTITTLDIIETTTEKDNIFTDYNNKESDLINYTDTTTNIVLNSDNNITTIPIFDNKEVSETDKSDKDSTISQSRSNETDKINMNDYNENNDTASADITTKIGIFATANVEESTIDKTTIIAESTTTTIATNVEDSTTTAESTNVIDSSTTVESTYVVDSTTTVESTNVVDSATTIESANIVNFTTTVENSTDTTDVSFGTTSAINIDFNNTNITNSGVSTTEPSFIQPTTNFKEYQQSTIKFDKDLNQTIEENKHKEGNEEVLRKDIEEKERDDSNSDKNDKDIEEIDLDKEHEKVTHRIIDKESDIDGKSTVSVIDDDEDDMGSASGDFADDGGSGSGDAEWIMTPSTAKLYEEINNER